MKKLLGLLAAFFLIAVRVHAEDIDKYQVDATIHSDGTVSIVETIDYNFGDIERHGIFRNIPVTKTNADNKKFALDISQISVSDPYTKSTSGDTLTIKIGDANRLITGKHTYVISYTVRGALAYFPDHDEFYWNLFGTQWDVPILTGNAQISVPGAPVVKLTCFTGAQGAQDKNCITSYNNGVAVVSLTKELTANEGMTGVVAFPKGTVAVEEPKEVVSFWTTRWGQITIVLLVLVSIFWYVVSPFLVIRYWWKNGRDPEPPMGVVSAWFSPPKTKNLRPLTPLETGTLIDETVDMRDIYGTIIDLARRGYLKITEKANSTFTFTKTKEWEGDRELQPFEKTLLDGIIGDKDTVKFEDVNLLETVRNVQKLVYTSLVADGFFPRNPQTVRTVAYVIGFAGMLTFNLFLMVVAFLFGKNMPRKTPFGAQSAAIGKSLKNFLGSQEKHLAFQAKNQMFFEKLLPFAVAFGVEKIWAKRFADVKMTPPDWYVTRNGVFNSMVFASSISTSYTSGFAVNSAYKSSSGFSSGFSGGGFSGGGGGGGGGGSW